MDPRPPGEPASPGRRSLLGIYPAPLPHMVGAPLPPAPGYPSRWLPPPPPLQYGIDYTFLRHLGSKPLRWRPDLPITVRIAGSYQPEQAAAVAAVVTELADLTGLKLRTGSHRPEDHPLRKPPTQCIHVAFVQPLPVVPFFRPCADRVGLGGAVSAPGSGHFTSGIALVTIVGASLPGSRRMPDEVAVLRHELAHALGLGHAARRGLLMYHRITAATADFGRGDRHGLVLLNENHDAGAQQFPNGHAPRPGPLWT